MDDDGKRLKQLRAEKSRLASLPKAFLYVRVGFEDDLAAVKQIPRYRLDKASVDRIFRSNAAFLQEAQSGTVVMPANWKDECLPPPALYYLREAVQPRLDPDAMEEALYRGSVAVFCLDVPDEVDEAALRTWLLTGLDDDDPEQVATRLRLDELQSRLADVKKQVSDVSASAIAGATVREELQIKEDRLRKLQSREDALNTEISGYEARLKDIEDARSGVSGESVVLNLRETVLPLRLNIWEIAFGASDRAKRMAYIATHKLNWGDFRLALPKSGSGPAITCNGPWPREDARYKRVSMRGVRVVRMQHGKGMYKFADERGFYSGQWRHGKRHGLGIEINSQGRFTGRHVREWRRGHGTQVHANGDVFRGSYGCPGFHDKMSLINGDEYADGVPHGEGNMRFVDGSEYAGEFCFGKPQGHGTFTNSVESQTKGNFGPLCMLDGRGSESVGDLVTSGTWQEGVLHGRGLRLDRALGKHIGMYRWGLKHGFGSSDGEPLDVNYHGNHKFGFRHGRGILNYGDVNRERRLQAERIEQMHDAAAGLTGARKVQVLAGIRAKIAAETGLASQADEAARGEGCLEGPGADEGAGGAIVAGLTTSSVMGTTNSVATRLASHRRATAKSGLEAAEADSEYKKYQTASVAYAGHIMYEGLWRSNTHRFGGCITLRLGQAQPHQHQRLASTNRRQTALQAVETLATREQNIHAARSRAVDTTAKEELSRRLEQEADNLRSFAYWQQVAQSRLARLKAKTAAGKTELDRIKMQLARPDEILALFPSPAPADAAAVAAVSAPAAASETFVLVPEGAKMAQPVGGVAVNEDHSHAYDRTTDGEVASEDGFDPEAAEGPRLFRDDTERFS